MAAAQRLARVVSDEFPLNLDKFRAPHTVEARSQAACISGKGSGEEEVRLWIPERLGRKLDGEVRK